MSLPLVITALLLWLSVPALLQGRLTPGRAALARRACRWAAAAVMCCALIYQYL